MPGTRGPVPVPLHDGARDVTQQILDALEGEASLETATKFPEIPQAEIKAALDRLASRQMLQYTTNDREQVLLTPEGQMICDSGSHEYKVWDAVRKSGKLEMKDLIVGGDFDCFAKLEHGKTNQGNLSHKLANLQKSARVMQ